MTATNIKAPTLSAAAVITALQKPEWIRLPQNGTACAFTGLRRSQMNELVLPSAANNFKPPVRSVSLRKPGGVKGTRLIHFASLMDYLARLDAEQNGGEGAA